MRTDYACFEIQIFHEDIIWQENMVVQKGAQSQFENCLRNWKGKTSKHIFFLIAWAGLKQVPGRDMVWVAVSGMSGCEWYQHPVQGGWLTISANVASLHCQCQSSHTVHVDPAGDLVNSATSHTTCTCNTLTHVPKPKPLWMEVLALLPKENLRWVTFALVNVIHVIPSLTGTNAFQHILSDFQAE